MNKLDDSQEVVAQFDNECASIAIIKVTQINLSNESR